MAEAKRKIIRLERIHAPAEISHHIIDFSKPGQQRWYRKAGSYDTDLVCWNCELPLMAGWTVEALRQHTAGKPVVGLCACGATSLLPFSVPPEPDPEQDQETQKAPPPSSSDPQRLHDPED
jgi:hypothetical protein